MLIFSTIKTNIDFYMFRTQFLVKKDYFWRALDFIFFPRNLCTEMFSQAKSSRFLYVGYS